MSNKAWPGTEALPALPASQAPVFTTRAPWHAASGHPHQYVTPSAPQTGSARKQFIGHPPGSETPLHTPPLDFSGRSSAACEPIKQNSNKSKGMLIHENDGITWNRLVPAIYKSNLPDSRSKCDERFVTLIWGDLGVFSEFACNRVIWIGGYTCPVPAPSQADYKNYLLFLI